MSSSISNFKMFLKKMSFFLLGLFLLFGLIEVGSRWILQKFFYGSLIFSQSITFFEQQASEIQVLFAGDSEVYYGLNPQEIQSSQKIHNFAFPAEGIVATYHKLEYYLARKKLPKLHTLILQFQPHSFDREKRFLLRGYGSYSRFLSKIDIWKIYGLKECVIQTLFESYFFHYRKLLSPQSLVGAWKQRHKPFPEKIMANGYGECDGQLNLTSAQAEAVLKIQQRHVADSTLIEYYQKTIQLAQTHKIQVYLMQLPTYVDIYAVSLADPESQAYQEWRKLEKIAQHLTQQFSSLRFFQPPLTLFSATHFRDTAHLNKAGTILLAQWLTQEFQKNPTLR